MEKKLEFTGRAKDQINKITKSEAKKYFRIAVQGGGCSGFKYNFSFDNEKTKDDILFESYEIKLDVEIISHIVNREKEKIYLHNPKRYFLLSSKISEKEKDLINKKLIFIKQEHGCQLIIDNPLHLIKRYIRIIIKIDFFVKNIGEMII